MIPFLSVLSLPVTFLGWGSCCCLVSVVAKYNLLYFILLLQILTKYGILGMFDYVLRIMLYLLSVGVQLHLHEVTSYCACVQNVFFLSACMYTQL